MKHTNRLIHETSPYLLQHAHNPVDWYPWGKEALDKAVREDKPILVSIGYSACHWCHVMERESFEDEFTADIMNRNFVNIKIDREERPDLDHVYMDAVQSMTGSGGWPLNVFLTPDTQPFYGGTYFPPVKAYNRPSWREILHGIALAYKERKEEIYEQAKTMTLHLQQSNSFGINENKTFNIPFEEKFTRQQCDLIFENILKTADKEWGGFGRAPKFPQTFIIQYLLRYHYFTGNKEALDQACLSLDKMICGGIYDQVGGGFARYSTDTEWLAPHFEKMLYDNALLITVLTEAYQLTGKRLYADTINDTMDFIQRELLSEETGFYSALDADSEGEEGKYYVWSRDEIEEILGTEAELFCSVYDIKPQGNWEHKNIPRLLKTVGQYAENLKIDETELAKRLRLSRQKLLNVRANRIRPLLDDKILLGWNALMNIACVKAYSVLQKEEYKKMAVKNMEFLFSKFHDENSGWKHVYKNGVAKYPAFLDDYAFLVQALLRLQEITGDGDYLKKAEKLLEIINENFADESGRYFFYTHAQQEDILVRKKELYDGAIPSGNSVMAHNLYHASIFLGKPDWKRVAAEMTEGISEVIVKYPGSFGIWAVLLLELVFGTEEIAVVGKEAEKMTKELMLAFMPNKVLQYSVAGSVHFPLLEGRVVGETTLIYLCRGYSCKNPVVSALEFFQLVETELKR